MLGLSTAIWFKSLLALVGVCALTFSHVYAYRTGSANERRAAMQRSIDTLRERAKTNEQIRSMDNSAMCRALGGRMQDGACV